MELMPNKFTNSELITEIYELFKRSPQNFVVRGEKGLTKAEAKMFGDAEIFLKQKLRQKLKEGEHLSVADYLSVLEEIISIYENTYKGKDRLGSAHNRRKNYLIDNVFGDKKNNPVEFRIWMFLGNELKNFILENNYYISYMVDGIDNIDFENAEVLNGYRRLLENLLEFPLSKNKAGHNTFEDLRENYYGYAVSRKMHDLEPV